MRDLGKGFIWRGADVLQGIICGSEIGMLFDQLGIFLDQIFVCSIVDLGCIESMIETLVMHDLGGEFGDTLDRRDVGTGSSLLAEKIGHGFESFRLGRVAVENIAYDGVSRLFVFFRLRFGWCGVPTQVMTSRFHFAGEFEKFFVAIMIKQAAHIYGKIVRMWNSCVFSVLVRLRFVDCAQSKCRIDTPWLVVTDLHGSLADL